MRTIRERWDEYATQNYTPDIPEDLWRLLRCAFFAGAVSLHEHIGDSPNPPQERHAYFEATERELHAFLADVIAGRA